MKISQQEQQTLKQRMSNPQLNLQAQFLENNHNNQQPPSLLSPQDYTRHPLKDYQATQSLHNVQNLPIQAQNIAQDNFNKFYSEFKRIYSVSFNLHLQKLRRKNIIQQLQERLSKLQDRLCVENISKPKDPKSAIAAKKQQNSEQNRNKRARRTAEQIQKKFKCEVAFCQRFYGSEGSLQQHIKLKHPELLNKDSEEEEYLPYHNKEAQQPLSE